MSTTPRANFHVNQGTGMGCTLVWLNHWEGIKEAQHGEETEAITCGREGQQTSLLARKPLL